MLAIFSRRNKLKEKKRMSIRMLTFATIVAVGIVSMLALIGTVLTVYISSAKNERFNNVKSDAALVANVISSNGFLYTRDNSTSSAEIDALADVYEGRILVVDSNLTIIKDTYSKETGKICISNEVIKCLNDGKEVRVNNEVTDYVELITPINSTEGSISGVMVIGYSQADISKMLSQLYAKSLIIALIIALIIGIVAWIISAKISKSIFELEKSVKKISAGYMDEEIKVDDFYETQILSESLNTMLSQLQRIENSRQEFVSNVSHELKTPITSMKVLADSLIMQEDVPAEIYKEFMQDIASEIERENKIITDLLALVKMDKSASELNVSNVNINDLLEVLLKRLRPLASQRNIEIVFESFRPVSAEVDETKISLAFSNLIENAIKYNYEDGWIRVSLNADHKYFYVKVSDSGVGIPEDCIDNIFDRFYRVDKARSRETGGTGLGLAITRNVILLHKGAIKVHSKEKEGTVFTVRIPLSYVV